MERWTVVRKPKGMRWKRERLPIFSHQNTVLEMLLGEALDEPIERVWLVFLRKERAALERMAASLYYDEFDFSIHMLNCVLQEFNAVMPAHNAEVVEIRNDLPIFDRLKGDLRLAIRLDPRT